MDSSLLKTLGNIIRFEQPSSLYAQFCHVEAVEATVGLCVVEDCASSFVTTGGSTGEWCLCAEHYLLASRTARRRHIRALFWQGVVARCFSDTAVYDPIVASGRYRKLCAMMEYASELVDEAWRAVIIEAKPAAETRVCKRRRIH